MPVLWNARIKTSASRIRKSASDRAWPIAQSDAYSASFHWVMFPIFQTLTHVPSLFLGLTRRWSNLQFSNVRRPGTCTLRDISFWFWQNFSKRRIAAKIFCHDEFRHLPRANETECASDRRIRYSRNPFARRKMHAARVGRLHAPFSTWLPATVATGFPPLSLRGGSGATKRTQSVAVAELQRRHVPSSTCWRISTRADCAPVQRRRPFFDNSWKSRAQFQPSSLTPFVRRKESPGSRLRRIDEREREIEREGDLAAKGENDGRKQRGGAGAGGGGGRERRRNKNKRREAIRLKV